MIQPHWSRSLGSRLGNRTMTRTFLHAHAWPRILPESGRGISASALALLPSKDGSITAFLSSLEGGMSCLCSPMGLKSTSEEMDKCWNTILEILEPHMQECQQHLLRSMRKKDLSFDGKKIRYWHSVNVLILKTLNVYHGKDEGRGGGGKPPCH